MDYKGFFTELNKVVDLIKREKNAKVIFDQINIKYIIFQDDETQENSYHGYHIKNDNEIPAEIKKIIKNNNKYRKLFKESY